MANAPAPFVYPSEYNDFEVHSITYDPKILDSSNTYIYPFTLEVENTGSGYLMYDLNLRVPAKSENKYPKFYTDSEFRNLIVRPGETAYIKGIADEEYDLSDVTATGEGFVEYSIVENYNFTFVNKHNHDDHYTPYYLYEYSVEGIEKSSGYYHSLIIDYEIGGEQYTMYSSTYNYADLISFTEVDQSEIHVTGVKLLKTTSYRGGTTIIGTILAFFGLGAGAIGIAGAAAAAIIVLVALFFLGLLISAAIVIPVLLVKKPWRKKQQSADSDENSVQSEEDNGAQE